MARLMGRGPHLGPITAWFGAADGAARMLIGGRNLAGRTIRRRASRCRSTACVFQQWDAPPGFFLKVFDIPAGRLAGVGALVHATVQSTCGPQIPTAIEQFDLQDEQATMWGYDEGWQEAEYSMALGVWRWTSDAATLRFAGPPRNLRITLTHRIAVAIFRRAAAGARPRRGA